MRFVIDGEYDLAWPIHELNDLTLPSNTSRSAILEEADALALRSFQKRARAEDWSDFCLGFVEHLMEFVAPSTNTISLAPLPDFVRSRVAESLSCGLKMFPLREEDAVRLARLVANGEIEEDNPLRFLRVFPKSETRAAYVTLVGALARAADANRPVNAKRMSDDEIES